MILILKLLTEAILLSLTAAGTPHLLFNLNIKTQLCSPEKDTLNLKVLKDVKHQVLFQSMKSYVLSQNQQPWHIPIMIC